MAMSRNAVAVAFTFLMLGLSGCIGEDAPDKGPLETDEKTAPVATADTGSLTGTAISDALETLEGVRVALVQGESAVFETSTDAEGTYTINEVPPGVYVLLASKPLYREIARSVQVDADTIVTVHLEMMRLSDTELGLPYADGPNSMGGFLSCGVGLYAGPGLPRGSINPCTDDLDPNAKNVFEFGVGEGLKTLLVGLTWKPAGGMGEHLNIGVETNESHEVDPTQPAYRFAYVTDKPDILIRIDEDDITDPQWTWSNITGSQIIQVRVFPGQTSPPTTTYQQAFTVWWEAWYHGEAPEGRNPIPDA